MLLNIFLNLVLVDEAAAQAVLVGVVRQRVNGWVFFAGELLLAHRVRVIDLIKRHIRSLVGHLLFFFKFIFFPGHHHCGRIVFVNQICYCFWVDKRKRWRKAKKKGPVSPSY